MKVGALNFLLQADGRPWIPTRAWALADPEGGNLGEDWVLSLIEPESDVLSLPLHDLKRWVLFGEKSERYLHLGEDRRGNLDLRTIPRDEAAEMYLRGILDSIGDSRANDHFNLLMPSIDDDKLRTRYLSILEEAAPNARILFEPEMVVEYFRLVQRSLVLDPDQNTVVLVVDSGASTTDMTLVFSNRGGNVVEKDTPRRRPGRLQAIQGTSSGFAGQWVDESIAEALGLELDPENSHKRAKGLADIERAKIAVAQGPTAVELGGKRLSVNLLKGISSGLIAALDPTAKTLRERLWAQIHGTEYAKQLSAGIRSSRGIQGPDDVFRMVDYVLLAGGSSRLPGFHDTIVRWFNPDLTTLLDVGVAFPIAAAVGGLAHILRTKYSPSRLRSGGAGGDDALPKEDLEAALDVDIELETRVGSRQSDRVVVLRRGDPLAVEGGVRDDEHIVDARLDDRIRARFVPDVTKREKEGLKPRILKALTDEPIVGIRVDDNRRLWLMSDDLRGADGVWLDLNSFDRVSRAALRVYDSPIPKGALAIDSADEVVIDFGMSKTVVVAAGVGVFHPADLEAVCAGQPITAMANSENDEPSKPDAVQKDAGPSSSHPASPSPESAHPTEVAHPAEPTPESPTAAERLPALIIVWPKWS